MNAFPKTTLIADGARLSDLPILTRTVIKVLEPEQDLFIDELYLRGKQTCLQLLKMGLFIVQCLLKTIDTRLMNAKAMFDLDCLSRTMEINSSI